MKKKNTSRHILSLIIASFVVIAIYSCSGDDNDNVNHPSGESKNTYLSIVLNASGGNNRQSAKWAGDPDYANESKIYSVEILVYKPDGTFDGYKAIARQPNGSGTDYKAIKEITDIRITAGKRSVYVVANAPDSYFASIADNEHTLDDFKRQYATLDNQKLYIYGDNPQDHDEPIGGITPQDWKSNLTMYGCMENVTFNNQYEHQYLGYTDNETGIPSDAQRTSNYAPEGNAAFTLERIVARVAIKKIQFDLPAQGLTFESSPTTNYTYHIESVFLANARLRSQFIDQGNTPEIDGNFAYGTSNDEFNFLKNKESSLKLADNSTQVNTLAEQLFTRSYDIERDVTKNDAPLWFYVFENPQFADHPTQLIISVRYNYLSSANGQPKTLKCYYPVIINKDGNPGNSVGHSHIKRNYQYGINITIKNLGIKTPSAELHASKQTIDTQALLVEETVGKNLFPWTGNVYK